MEYKFRAWDKILKAFVPRFVIENTWEGHCFQRMPWVTDLEQNILYWKDNVVIMQYTGLKDKNWKEIYEWDIVEFIEYKDTATVIYEGWTFKIYWHNPPKACPPEQLLFWKNYDCEIVWNIHENNNLLTKKND